MSKKVKIAVIGCGGIANSVHLPSLSEINDCEIVAVCDLVEEKAKKAAAKYSIPKTYVLMSEMLKNEEIDGVYCLVQPDLLYRVAYDCICAGKDIFMEKPAGLNSYQAESLTRKATSLNRMIQVGMNRRYVPLVQYVFDKMKKITPITQVDGCFIKHADIASIWHFTDAFTCDIVHAADLVRYLAGSEVENAATVIARNNSPVDNSWSSVMKFENGVTGTLRGNYQTAARIHNFEIHGPEASAYINLGFPGTDGCDATIVYSSGVNMYSQAAAGVGTQNIEKIDGIQLAGGNKSLYAHYGYKQEDEAFINFLMTGKKPICLIDDAAKSMRMVEFLLNNRINK
ncbi:MAG: Gfo/Idh/MocA family oxidoreductase [Clostridia bacterium]